LSRLPHACRLATLSLRDALPIFRCGNLSAMDHHPIHLHGYAFRVTETDGGPIPTAGQWPETTVLVPTGATRTVEFEADAPGDWRSEEHTSELQSRENLVCRLLLE